MEENEIKIDNKHIGFNSQVTITVKTILYLLGLLIALLTSLFTWFYFNTQARENELRVEMNTIMKENHNDMKSEILSLRQQVFDLARGQGEMKVDLKTVINKQVGSNERINHDNTIDDRFSPSAPR